MRKNTDQISVFGHFLCSDRIFIKLIFEFHHDGHCLSCVFMVVYNNTAYLVKMDVPADHQLFCQLCTNSKKLLTLSALDWHKAQLELCSVYQIATQNRSRCGRSTYFAGFEICFILDVFNLLSSSLTDFTIVQTLTKLVQIFGASELSMGLRGSEALVKPFVLNAVGFSVVFRGQRKGALGTNEINFL